MEIKDIQEAALRKMKDMQGMEGKMPSKAATAPSGDHIAIDIRLCLPVSVLGMEEEEEEEEGQEEGKEPKAEEKEPKDEYAQEDKEEPKSNPFEKMKVK